MLNLNQLEKTGGYSPVRKVTIRDCEVFRRAFLNGPIGVSYTPLTCMTQVVAGTKYLFGAKETIINEDETIVGIATVEIFEELISNGGGVYIKHIERPGIVTNKELTDMLFDGIDITRSNTGTNAGANTSSKVGAYTEPHALSEDDKEVFESVEFPEGVTYVPYEVATQVVSGTNYRFSCKAKALSPSAKEYEAYVYIFKALPCYGGGTAITLIEEID